MFNYLFRKPSPKEVIATQLYEAQLGLLESRSNEEYFAHLSKMYEKRIERLQAAEKNVPLTTNS